MPQLPESVTVTTALTLTGSLSSLLGSAFILICYAVLPLEYHFRHVLILNLSIADFFNAVTNSIGGIYIFALKRTLDPGPACNFQGLVGQVTVQATDCTILAITLSTVSVITEKWRMPRGDDGSRYRQIIFTSCAIWALPLFTGFLALGMGWYAPATGNWCWLVAQPAYLRYALTHAWRILFIIIEICLYTYLHIWLRRHYQRMVVSLRSVDIVPAGSSDSRRTPSSLDSSKYQGGSHGYYEQNGASSSILVDREGAGSSRPKIAADSTSKWSLSQMTGLRGTHQASHSLANNLRYQAIRRMLLLNAYPLAYIILWIPGIVNRLIEASGHSSNVMQAIQASTQFVGLANALTYGWNERIATRVRERFRN
jgi:hypothetical protein